MGFLSKKNPRQANRYMVRTAKFTHIDDESGVHMVDISVKESSERCASAEGTVQLGADAYSALVEERVTKGDVLTTAQLAGIMGAKETARLIPLCHPIALEAINLTFSLNEKMYSITVRAEATSVGRTGVEMEVLTAVSIASLAIYDMCKSISKDIRITNIHLVSKKGGVHGAYYAHDSH